MDPRVIGSSIRREPPPIVIVHRGYSACALACVAQAVFHYSGQVILVHDGVDGAEGTFICQNISNYVVAAEHFRSIYRHLSVNDNFYERFCFERWFIIREVMRVAKLDRVVAMDSDVLIYPGVDNTIFRLSTFPFSSWTHFASLSFDALDAFCNNVIDIYANEERFNMFAEHVSARRGLAAPHISDMDFFEQFASANGGVSMNEHFLVFGVDPNIGLGHDCEMDSDRKRIYWMNEAPAVRNDTTKVMYKLSSLHLQGHAKRLVSELRSSPIGAEPLLLRDTMSAVSARSQS